MYVIAIYTHVNNTTIIIHINPATIIHINPATKALINLFMAH